MKLVAIVVIFNPNLEEVIANILSYIDDVEKLLLYRNSKTDIITAKELEPFIYKLEYLGNGDNVGIASALSSGAKWMIDNDFTHLLTLDQDSYFDSGQLRKFRLLVANSQTQDVGIYAANPSNRGNLTYDSSSQYVEVADAITSGSIFSRLVFEECGLFANELFIDAVDYEFCYRALSLKGLKTIVYPEVVLKHEVGYPHKIIFGLTCDNYSAFRTYFIIRNHIIIWKRYPRLFPYKYKKTLIKMHVIYRLITIILGEADKLMKIKAISVGIIHGLFGKTGFYKL